MQGKHIHLTPEGEVLVQKGEELLHQRDMVFNAIHSVNETGGVLRLGIPIGRGNVILPVVMPEFHKRYPNAQVELHEGHTKDPVYWLQSGTCDIAIFNKPTFAANLEYQRIGYEQMHLLVGRSSPWAEHVTYDEDNRAHIDMSILKDAELVLNMPWQHTGLVARRILHNAGIQEPKVKLMTKNLAAAYFLAATGYALAFLSDFHINRLSDGADVHQCVLDDPLAMMEVCIACPRIDEMSHLARAFSDLTKTFLF